MIDQTTDLEPIEQTPPDRAMIVHPATGETVVASELKGSDLAQLLEDSSTLYDMLRQFKASIVTEVARRADMRGERKTELDGIVFEVNAPTEDQYEVEDLRATLQPLVDSSVIDQQLLDALIVMPTPKPPSPRVDRRRLKSLMASDNRELLAALAQARTRVVNQRTAKIVGKTVEATAEEVIG